MNSFPRKLLTIVTEAAIEHLLTQELERLGAHGYTIADARGKGHRGVRSADWSASSNVRIEVICDDITAARIADYLRQNYYENYAMILWLEEVAVLRPEKF